MAIYVFLILATPFMSVVASLRMTAGFLLLMSPASAMRALVPDPPRRRE